QHDATPPLHSSPPRRSSDLRSRQLRTVGVGRNGELLHHLVAELIGRPVAPARLREESVVVVAAIHQKTGVPAPQPAISQVAIRPDRKSTRLNSSHLGISYAV